MGFCLLGGKENYLRKLLSDKLTALGKAIGLGATPPQYTEKIQEIYDERYTAGYNAGQLSVKSTTYAFNINSGENISTQSYNTGKGSKLIGASVIGIQNLRFYSWQENYNAYTVGGVMCTVSNGVVIVSFNGQPTRATNTTGGRTNVIITVRYWYYE